MTSPFSSMTEHERNAALAALLGWTCQEEERYWPNKEMVWRDAQGMKVSAPHFTTSLDAMRLVEDKIQNRDRVYWYLLELYRMACETPDMDAIRFLHFHEVWFLLYATPAQRAEAALRALTGA